MKHFILNDNYIIVDDSNKTLLSIDLVNELPNNQIILKLPKEVYAGPIEFLAIKEEPLIYEEDKDDKHSEE